MTLSEIHSGQTAFVIKINDTGAYAKRLIEMGFVKGRKVYVVKNAPLKDPIEYELMGYNISLRRKEADLIEVELEETKENKPNNFINFNKKSYRFTLSKPDKPPHVHNYQQEEQQSRKEIKVALVGNPNCGKTTLFNYISGLDQHVGNYSGVTVESYQASVKFRDYTITITDLPGTYSLSAYSPEEVVVRESLKNGNFDFIINVVDATLLERNLYLTTQLMDMDIPVIIALNMYDELLKSGDTFNHKLLSKLFAIPFIPTVAKKGRGVPHILAAITKNFEITKPKNINTNLGTYIEDKICKILCVTSNNDMGFTDRFAAIMVLEKDKYFLSELPEEQRDKCTTLTSQTEAEYKEEITQIVADARYGYIAGALRETLKINQNRYKQSNAIDTVLTHKIWGFPIFISIMWFIFYATFTLGKYPQIAIETLFENIQIAITNAMNEGALRDLLVDGIVGGVGSVVVFFPNILLLFLFISILEDSGYMARASFIMDKLMHKIGLHGKSFIPLVMGFGCNVPAIMASRIIEDRNNRILTILITPFMSCSARLPVYMLIVGAFFPSHAGSILFGIYATGIAIAVVSSILFKKILFKGNDHPFVMELPPYRTPSARTTIKHMWNKGSQYIQKMGGIILIAVMVIWSLSYYPNKDDSYLKRIGHVIEPVVAPLGFDWKIGVGLVSGVAAKEIIVSTMGVINQVETEDDANEYKLAEKLREDTYTSGPRIGQKVFTTASALSFLAFVLIYFPCIAVVAAVRKEAESWKWAIITVLYTTSLAWIVSFLIYQLLK